VAVDQQQSAAMGMLQDPGVQVNCTGQVMSHLEEQPSLPFQPLVNLCPQSCILGGELLLHGGQVTVQLPHSRLQQQQTRQVTVNRIDVVLQQLAPHGNRLFGAARRDHHTLWQALEHVDAQ
jgi:hypothetical protein